MTQKNRDITLLTTGFQGHTFKKQGVTLETHKQHSNIPLVIAFARLGWEE